ncbi:MAG: histidine kinase [Bacteroidota bacterium]
MKENIYLAKVNMLLLTNTKSVLFHFLFWVVVWFFFVYFFSYNSTNTVYVTWFSSFLLPVTMILTYFVIYILIPKYLLTKKYKLFALYSFYTLVISTYLIVLAIFGSFIYLSNLNITNMPPMSRNFVFVLILVYLIVGIISFVSLLNHNFRTVSRNRELENEILETQLQLKDQELQYLKKQIHPHFLFNTLNTIYGFALKQSKNTPDIILKLSNLLDYILYQVNKPMVSLKEEILHVKEYVDLEKIRFQDTLKVLFTFNEIADETQIAPMLLIPFVENAFKHGSLINGFLRVEIEIALVENQLIFSIQNSFLNDNTDQVDTGIGLENIKKRMELHYSNNYHLRIENKDNWFSVNLTILNINTIKNA